MTVSELIEALKEMPQEREVYFKRDFYSDYMEINSVFFGAKEVVLMERKND